MHSAFGSVKAACGTPLRGDKVLEILARPSERALAVNPPFPRLLPLLQLPALGLLRGGPCGNVRLLGRRAVLGQPAQNRPSKYKSGQRTD